MDARARFLPACLLIAAFVLAGCSDDAANSIVPNQPPIVIMSADPIRDTQNGAVATFSWIASDPDGEIEEFRYAIDDTVGTDAWFITTQNEVTLAFSAPDSARIDTIYVDPSPVPIERYIFNGAHTLFVKAIDDDGAESATAFKSFTAESVAPETEILTPTPHGYVFVGDILHVNWKGIDPDDVADPVGYSWRLVQVPNVLTLNDEQVEATLYDPAANGDPWTEFAAVTEAEMELPLVPGQYLFGVRSLDRAGAIEPRIRTFRSPSPPNTLLIRALATGGQPRLRVSTAEKSTLYPVNDPRRKNFHIPANADVIFTWEAELDHYGGQVAGFSYGVDLEDLSEENPLWAPESPDLTRINLRFDVEAGGETEIHDLFVRLRDTFGTTLIAELNLFVVPFSFERDVLYVDDWGDDDTGYAYPALGDDCSAESEGGNIPDEKVRPSASVPQDLCHDSYLRAAIERVLATLGHDEWVVDRYEPLDPRTGQYLVEDLEIDSLTYDYLVYQGPISIEELSRYKAIIWNTRSSGVNALSHLNSDFEQNQLGVYMEAGGHLLLTGTGTYSRTLFGGEAVGLSIFGFSAEDFLYRLLKVRSRFDGLECREGCFRQTGETARYQRDNGFEGAYTSAMAAAEGFPELRIARPPYAANPVKGIEGCEAMVVPYGLEMNGELALQGGRLDTLYFYQSNLRLEVSPPGTSWMDDGAVGLRYSGPEQGNLIVLGFPLFYLPDDQVDDLLSAALRWMLEE